MSVDRSAQGLLEHARHLIAANPNAETRDVRLLLGHVLGKSEAQVFALGPDALDRADADRFLELVARRAAGEPYAYLVGEREFHGRPFLVDPRVLIPRPETELLVEATLEGDLAEGALVIDVGVGSGCIALTLAAERPDLRVVGIDVSIDALAVASENRRRLGLEDRVRLVGGDLLTALGRAADVVVSNPPYVERSADLAAEVRDHEPDRALFADACGDADALAAYRRLLGSGEALKPGGRLIVEIGFGQAAAIRKLAGAAFVHRATRSDLAGIERVLEWTRAEAPGSGNFSPLHAST